MISRLGLGLFFGTPERSVPYTIDVEKFKNVIKQTNSLVVIKETLDEEFNKYKQSLGARFLGVNRRERSNLKQAFVRSLIDSIDLKKNRPFLQLPVVVNCEGSFTFKENIDYIAKYIDNWVDHSKLDEVILLPLESSSIELEIRALLRELTPEKKINEFLTIVSKASEKHPDNNHDRATSFMMGDVRVMMACDGVSRCDGGHTGEAAASTMVNALERALTFNQKLIEIFEKLTDIANKYPSVFSGKAVMREDETGSLVIDNEMDSVVLTVVKELRYEITSIINQERLSIRPVESATTLELAFVFGNKKKTVLTLSCGDSQTVIYNNVDHSIKQLNATLYRKKTSILLWK
jgi:hypothetical protein